MSRLTAGASGHVLILALRRADWGTLAGSEFKGVRMTYMTLVLALDGKTGQGKATVEQIARQAGYSEAWTRRCLQVLEQLDLIEWHRGGVVAGKPVPSWFRVSKQALLILISIARGLADEQRAVLLAETRARISSYRLTQTRRRSQNSRSVHPKVDRPLLSIKEVPEEAEPPENRPSASPEAIADAVQRMKADIRSAAALKRSRGQESKTATTTRAEQHPALAHR